MIVIVSQPHMALAKHFIIKLIIQYRFSHICHIHRHAGIVRDHAQGLFHQLLTVIFRPGSYRHIVTDPGKISGELLHIAMQIKDKTNILPFKFFHKRITQELFPCLRKLRLFKTVRPFNRIGHGMCDPFAPGRHHQDKLFLCRHGKQIVISCQPQHLHISCRIAVSIAHKFILSRYRSHKHPHLRIAIVQIRKIILDNTVLQKDTGVFQQSRYLQCKADGRIRLSALLRADIL